MWSLECSSQNNSFGITWECQKCGFSGLTQDLPAQELWCTEHPVSRHTLQLIPMHAQVRETLVYGNCFSPGLAFLEDYTTSEKQKNPPCQPALASVPDPRFAILPKLVIADVRLRRPGLEIRMSAEWECGGGHTRCTCALVHAQIFDL